MQTYSDSFVWLFVVFGSIFLDNRFMLTKEQAIELAGSQAKLAKILGIDRRAVWNWKNIPQGRIYQLMVMRPEWFDKKYISTVDKGFQ